MIRKADQHPCPSSATRLPRTNVCMNFMTCFDIIGMAFSLLSAALACVFVGNKNWQKTMDISSFHRRNNGKIKNMPRICADICV